MRGSVRDKIRDWYLKNKRPLPWRETRDPYHVWVSEIILQQTRVVQGATYYHRFLEKFPDLKSLALASEEEVLRIWQGLGYYSRARNMHTAAKYVYRNLSGTFPRSYTEILGLKGVGPYTAAAVASIAFHEPRAVVDGNVHRVISRLMGIEESPEGYRASSRIVEEAVKLLDPEDPGTHNQAIMELGALVCTPRQPDCRACPLREDCFAFNNGRTADLPLRAVPGSKRKRYFNYLVVINNCCLWLGQRKEKDIWQGLYEFPLIETARRISPGSLVKSADWIKLLGRQIRPETVSKEVRHILSHQEIHARFYRIHLGNDNVKTFSLQGFQKINRGEIDRYPVPRLIGSYLEKLPESFCLE